MVEQYAQGSYGMTPTKDGDFVKYQDYKEALAEKDREIARLKQWNDFEMGMRLEKYQQLMEQAVRFAKWIYEEDNDNEEVKRFLIKSKASLKERE